jgi:hypothetical protein
LVKHFYIKYKFFFWLFAITTAWIFDFLFWEKPGGINFFIIVILAVLGGLLPMWLNKISFPWRSYLLLLPVTVFGAFTFIRSEPMTTVMNVLFTIGFLSLFTISLRNGEWFRFRFKDHFINFFNFFLTTIVGSIQFFNTIKITNETPNENIGTSQNEGAIKDKINRKTARAYLRGLLLALPIILVFSLLLASADPVFGSRIFNLINWFDPENLGEIIFRVVYILILANLLLGAYFFGLVKSKEISDTARNKTNTKTLLGTIETSIILGAVNLLFLSFVLAQFSYLFGGDQNISIEGFTYAEYARRGFFELLAVAIISNILFYTLSRVTARKTKAQKRLFSGLSLTLVVLVGIILFSAFTRLTLYEDAYGFTRLRTFTHVFIIWTGVLLIALGILEITKKMKRLPVVLIVSLIGFGLAINFLNVDRVIVRHNIQRAQTQITAKTGDRLDSAYLSELSFDSIPPVRDYYLSEGVQSDLREALGAILACQWATLDLPQKTPWTSWHYARSRAINQLKALETDLADYRIYQSENPWGWFVEINHKTFPCNSNRLWD